MTYLLDTVAVSALRVPQWNPSMARWAADVHFSKIWISALTIGEIQQGVVTQPDMHKRSELNEWLAEFCIRNAERVLPFGEAEARLWGTLTGPMHLKGNPPGTIDSLIAATALVHGLFVVTRNVKHFESFGVPVINPWDDESGA